jgi:inorganic pyrophosphatase
MDKDNSKVIVLVEIPKGSCQKYEFDEKLGGIKLDRSIYSSIYFPFEYGFIKDTLGEDGDPLDCVLISSFSTFPGCYVPARVIGLLEMEDEAGIDHKILALPDEKVDPRLAHIKELGDLPEHMKKEIKAFWEDYKKLETGKWVKLKDFKGNTEAEKILEQARRRKEFGS